MLVTILPFLLTARLTPEHPQEKYHWQYGGEMTFNVLVDLSRFDIDRGRRIYCSTISNELKCRVKDTEALSCYFLDPVVTLSTINNNSTCEWSRNHQIAVNDCPFDREPFEIRYDSRGIENLVVSRTIPRWKLDVTKAIVNQLHVGFEFKEGQSKFKTIENFNFGHCELDSKVLVSGKHHENEEHVEKNFEMILLDSNELRYRDILDQNGQIIIEKIRHPKNCPRRPIYFFGFPTSRRDDTEKGTFMEMISSKTRMVISKRGFSSETISEGVPITMNGSNVGLSRQRIILFLKSVNPARNLPPTIPNPASTSIHTYSSFDHYTKRMLRRNMETMNKRDRRGAKKDDKKNIPLTYKDSQRWQDKKRCLFCQYSFFIKNILRVVIREYPIFTTLMMIQLTILEGYVISNKKHTISFLKINKDQEGSDLTQEDIISRLQNHYDGLITDTTDHNSNDDNETRWQRLRRFFGRLFNRNQRNATDEISIGNNKKENSGTIDEFLSRLAENLEIERGQLEDCIDYVTTTQNEILLELNLQKLTTVSAKNADIIKCAMINICWKPKEVATSEVRYQHENVKNHSANNSNWFELVDRECVIPFQSNFYGFTFHNSLANQNLKNLLNKCIHKIEEHSINTFSWYTNKYLYHDYLYPRSSFSYQEYLEYQSRHEIFNPKVIVDQSNPLKLGIPFAHVITANFYSYHRYIRDYMREINLFPNSIIRMNVVDFPFIVRSLNPENYTHMFHIVYKKNVYNRPTYEDLYKGLVLLRDLMNKMKLKDLAMCKIGSFYERLNFNEILKMTEFVFLNTDIKIRIGLNLNTNYRLMRSNPTERDTNECFDYHVNRINQYFSFDSVHASRTALYSTNEN
uniref:Vitellogenin domain-containing protein n=1 Tax=Vespula pensylvanica TaxID=30213 RepID=A0A834JTQ6_VESPE|nr:hypothetical protein H0235_016861 [Vespula pensylvanica]